LRAARLAFAEVGYAATTNRELAARAGITTAAIYHYFPSKADLYLAVLEELDVIVSSAFEEAAAGLHGLIPRFCAVLDSAVALNRGDPSVAAFVVGVGVEARRHPELAELIRHRPARSTAFIHRLVAEAREAGELSPGVDARGLEDLLNSVLSGLARFSTATASAERYCAAVEAFKCVLIGTAVNADSST
jgi:AcrR family transcriptional regulator